MRYRNTISGEVIEVDAPISGEFWEDADADEAEAREAAEEAETDDTSAEEKETDEPKKKGKRKKA